MCNINTSIIGKPQSIRATNDLLVKNTEVDVHVLIDLPNLDYFTDISKASLDSSSAVRIALEGDGQRSYVHQGY